MTDYAQHIKNSVLATGCAPTLKVHLYVIRLIAKILLKYALQDKKIFIFFDVKILFIQSSSFYIFLNYISSYLYFQYKIKIIFTTG